MENKVERAKADAELLADLQTKYGDIFNAIEANQKADGWPSDADTAVLFRQLRDNVAAVGNMINQGISNLTAVINPMPQPVLLGDGQVVMSKAEVDAMAARIKQLEANKAAKTA